MLKMLYKKDRWGFMSTSRALRRLAVFATSKKVIAIEGSLF